MTRLEFEQEKTKRISVLADALKSTEPSQLVIRTSSKQAIADAILKTIAWEYPELIRTKFNPESNEKLV